MSFWKFNFLAITEEKEIHLIISISKQCMESYKFHSTYAVICGLLDDVDYSKRQNLSYVTVVANKRLMYFCKHLCFDSLNLKWFQTPIRWHFSKLVHKYFSWLGVFLVNNLLGCYSMICCWCFVGILYSNSFDKIVEIFSIIVTFKLQTQVSML